MVVVYQEGDVLTSVRGCLNKISSWSNLEQKRIQTFLINIQHIAICISKRESVRYIRAFPLLPLIWSTSVLRQWFWRDWVYELTLSFNAPTYFRVGKSSYAKSIMIITHQARASSFLEVFYRLTRLLTIASIYSPPLRWPLKAFSRHIRDARRYNWTARYTRKMMLQTTWIRDETRKKHETSWARAAGVEPVWRLPVSPSFALTPFSNIQDSQHLAKATIRYPTWLCG